MMRVRSILLLFVSFQTACESKTASDNGSSTPELGNEESSADEAGDPTEATPGGEGSGEPEEPNDELDDESDDEVDDGSGTELDDVPEDDQTVDDTGSNDTITGEEEEIPSWPEGTDPFADAVVLFDAGPDAGFGMESFPDIVLGSPEGGGAGSGSLDVLSLGEQGSIVLEFTDLTVFDGPGPDIIVFENPFGTWFETAIVEASADGEEWFEWPCAPEDIDGDYPGCAGVGHVFATSELLVDPTDPEVAGGDAFDLADIGLETARYVRITDTGFNALGYGGTAGGFDLDAVAISNWESVVE